MTKPLQWQDKYGSYQLIARENYIESKIVGAIGDDITARFYKDISTLAMSYAGRPFGYFADLSASEGWTENAQRNIVRSYKLCIQLGCVIDALILDSPLVKSQMQQISDLVDISVPLEVRIFKHRVDALAFIQKIVDKHTSA